MTINRFPFIDASYAAELLDVRVTEIFAWIESGRLQTYGGKDRNPFVRTAQVEELARELGRDINQPPPKKRAADDPIRRIELRLRHDSRWSNVSEQDIEDWGKRLDHAGRVAAREVAGVAAERLQRVIALIDNLDG